MNQRLIALPVEYVFYYLFIACITFSFVFFIFCFNYVRFSFLGSILFAFNFKLLLSYYLWLLFVV